MPPQCCQGRPAIPRWACGCGLHGRPHDLGIISSTGKPHALADTSAGWAPTSILHSSGRTCSGFGTWEGPMIIKGILDARTPASRFFGAMALFVSIMGGRQLDGVLCSSTAPAAHRRRVKADQDFLVSTRASAPAWTRPHDGPRRDFTLLGRPFISPWPRRRSGVANL